MKKRSSTDNTDSPYLFLPIKIILKTDWNEVLKLIFVLTNPEKNVWKWNPMIGVWQAEEEEEKEE